MNVTELAEYFAMPGVLAFHETPSGLGYIEVTTPHAKATVYLQGAHLTHWQPSGEGAAAQPIIFLSRKSDLTPGKAIRGGVPIIFPWFGPRHDGKPGPSHGFARIQDWDLAFAALAGDDLHLTLTLSPTELSRTLGYDHFKLVYQLTIGCSLTMQLTVANHSNAPLLFEEALHTYYSVADIDEVTLTGLEGTTYLDKTDNMQAKVQHGAVTITGPTDRVYLDTASACLLHDTAGKRSITIVKTNSNTTVVWNPWESGAQKLPDMDPTEWHEFIAVETVNADVNSITLASGETHSMKAHITIEDIDA
jgi:glucose-6-phosphate 1-epimerase